MLWDHVGALHNAVPDYGLDGHRLIKRCQFIADRVSGPEFVRGRPQLAAQ